MIRSWELFLITVIKIQVYSESLLMKVKEESKKSWLKAQHSEKKKDHGIQSHHFMANGQTVKNFILGSAKSLQMVIADMKLKDAYSLEEKLWPT